MLRAGPSQGFCIPRPGRSGRSPILAATPYSQGLLCACEACSFI